MGIEQRIRNRLCQELLYYLISMVKIKSVFDVKGKILFCYSAKPCTVFVYGNFLFYKYNSMQSKHKQTYLSQTKYRASHIKSDYLYALKTKIRTLYFKNLVFSARNILQWPIQFFLNDSFYLNFPISRENRNLEPITIRYDVGHPLSTNYSFSER